MRLQKRKRSLLGGGVKYATAFEGTERDLLLNLAATVADSPMERARSAPKDELVEMTDMSVEYSEVPSDLKLARLLPDFTKPDEESVKGENVLTRQPHGSEIVESKPHSLRTIIDAPEPAESEQVSISESDARAWVVGINDLRIYLHIPMGNLNGSTERTEQIDAMHQQLSYNQKPLLDQLMGEQRIRAKPRKMQ